MFAFFTSEFWNIANPELWVAVGLLIFFGVIIWAGAHKTALGALDAKSAAIQRDLDEAARIRREAEALLLQIKADRERSEAQGREMLADAEAEARRLGEEAKLKLEEQIERRTALADRRIATAEAQAAQAVKAAAAELASDLAERVLSARIAKAKSDPLVDKALGELAGRLQ
jgi:F-type H+-transporting ATPase subunit b